MQAHRVRQFVGASRPHLFFLAFCLVAITYASSTGFGLRMLAKLATPLAFMLALLCCINSRQQIAAVARSILASATLLIILAVATRSIGLNPDPRFSLPGLGPSVFSAQLMVSAMLGLALYLRGRSRHLLLFLCVVFIAIVAAFTRITIFGAFFGASFVLFLSLRGFGRYVIPILGTISVPALFLLSPRFRARMFIDADFVQAGSALATPGSVLGNVRGSGRFELWRDVLALFFEPNPMFGSGLGATQAHLYGSTGGGIGVVHSEYVRLLCEVGIIGALLFCIAMTFYFYRAVKAASRATNSSARTYSIAAAGGLVCYLVYMATDNAFDYVNQFGITVFALIGLSEKANALSSPGSGLEIARRSRTYPQNLLGVERSPSG